MKNHHNYKKWIGVGVAAVLVFFILIMPGMKYIMNGNSGMDSSIEEAKDMDGGYEESIESEMGNNESADIVEQEPAMDDSVEIENTSLVNRKIIKNAHIDIEITEFNKVVKEITEYINKNGGYIQNSNINSNNRGNKEYREGYITLRIPQESLDETINNISEKGKVNNVSINSNDITKQYMDNEARLKNLEVQEKRLRELISKAEKIEDVLNIENELRRIRTEIEQIQSTLNNWDNLVSLSTIDLRIIEVESIGGSISTGDDNILDNAKEGFISTINIIISGAQSIFVFIITMLPVILILGFFLILYLLWRKKRNNTM